MQLKPHPTMNHKCQGVRIPNLSFLPLSSHQPTPALFQKELQAAVWQWLSLLNQTSVTISPFLGRCHVTWMLPIENLPHTTYCREPARDIPLVTKVMRKGARHTQRRDRASGVPPDILEHLPPKKPESAYFIALCSHLWLYWGLSPTTISLSLSKS